MKYIEIVKNEDFNTVVGQVSWGYILGDTSSWIATEIEEGLYHEVMEDDACHGGKTIEQILHDEGLSVKYFIERYLPMEFDVVNPTDLGKIKFIATHGDCPECGFDMEADGRNTLSNRTDAEYH